LILTWRLVWVIFGEGHLGLEIAAIIERVRVEDDECEIPVVYVFFIKLYPLV
jgi:hypothetical protein